MKLIGNIIWLIFGGLESALAYFTSSLILALTIIGFPFAVQTFKIGIMTLCPFDSEIISNPNDLSFPSFIMNIIWIIIGGFWIFLIHISFGILLAITIIGLPFAKQHFKLAILALAPFGKSIV